MMQDSDYSHVERRGPAAAVVCGILGVIATVVVIARFRSRIFLQHNAAIDDWVFLAAMVSILTYTDLFYTINMCIALRSVSYHPFQFRLVCSNNQQCTRAHLWQPRQYTITTCTKRMFQQAPALR